MCRFIVQGALLVLALVTGSVMIALAALLPSPPLTPPPQDAAAVHRFYSVVNAVISTGDTSLLHTVVAPYFVERTPLPGEETGRSGLETYLAMLHSLDPGLRLVAEDVATAGELTVAHVSVVPDKASPLVTTSTVDLLSPWSSVDVLRVSRGLIVEHWSQTDGTGLVRPLAQLSLDLSAPVPRVVTINRVTLATGAQWISHSSGPHLLFLETGTVLVEANEVRSRAPAPSRASSRRALSAGQSLLMAGAGFTLTNTGPDVAGVVIAIFAVPQAPDDNRVGDVGPNGTTVQTLAGGLATDVGIGRGILSLGQVYLAPGAHLAVTREEGPTLIAVDAGHLNVITSAPAWMRRGSDGGSRQAYEARLTGGDGVVLSGGSLSALQNQGDDTVVALVLTLRANPNGTSMASIPTPADQIAGVRSPNSLSPRYQLVGMPQTSNGPHAVSPCATQPSATVSAGSQRHVRGSAQCQPVGGESQADAQGKDGEDRVHEAMS